MSVEAARDRNLLGLALSTLTDEEVVTRVLAGETALFEVLMRRHNQRLFRTARAIVRDTAEAEDVIQETYVRAFAQLAQFEHRAMWATWVTRIAVNEALTRVRRRGRFVDTDIERVQERGGQSGQRGPNGQGAMQSWMEPPNRVGGWLGDGSGVSEPEPGPENEASARELIGFLERAVDELPDIYRMVFVMREVEGLSTSDTAASLDISEDLVKVRLHRARAELRRALESGIGTAQRDLFSFGLGRCDRVVATVLARIATL